MLCYVALSMYLYMQHYLYCIVCRWPLNRKFNSAIIVSSLVLWTNGICQVLYSGLGLFTLRGHRRRQEQNNNTLNVICKQTIYLWKIKEKRKPHGGSYKSIIFPHWNPEHHVPTKYNMKHESPLLQTLTLQLYCLHSCSHFKNHLLSKHFLSCAQPG